MNAPAHLLTGRTHHRREQPFVRAFSARIAMIDLDIDRLDEAAADASLFSVNRLNAFAFHAKDQGERTETASLRHWAENRFAEQGVRVKGGQIRLCAFPRVLGYGFSPISVWFGHGPNGDLRGVIYEVHNTFGETHSYVCAFDPEDMRAEAAKEFHVSPFFGTTGKYRFTLRNTQSHLDLTVENIDVDGRSHVATLNVARAALTNRSILNCLISMPMSGLGVMLAIYWQALLLLLRGARYRDKPVQRANRTTPVERPETLGGKGQVRSETHRMRQIQG